MKILIVAGYGPSLLNFRGELLYSIQSLGWEVHVAAPEFIENKTPDEFQTTGWICHGFSMGRKQVKVFQDIKTFWELFRLYKQVKPEVLLSYTIKPVIYGSLAGYFARIPKRYALITGLGYTFQENTPQFVQKLASSLYTVALLSVNKVFFQNPDDELLFRTQKILRPEGASCVVNGSGVDLEHFRLSPFPSQPAFLLIARLLVAKGLREYARAGRILKARLGNWKLYLLGPEDESADSIPMSEVISWQQEGVLEYLGSTTDVKEYLQKSSVYVLPSYREGTPRTVLEAMAMGRPIITTDAPGCRQTVIEGQNGYLVAPQNAEELAEAMFRFIQQPGLIESMGMKSREIAEQKFDVHQVNAVMLKEMEIS